MSAFHPLAWYSIRWSIALTAVDVHRSDVWMVAEQETATWTTIYNKLKNLYPTHACSQFNKVFPLLEQNCGFVSLQNPIDRVSFCCGSSSFARPSSLLQS